MLNVNKKAFTLVELIVVITILSILGIIAFISLQGYTKIARDTSRISDISKIKTSLELFALESGKYPNVTDGIQVQYSTMGVNVWNQGTFGYQTFMNVEKLDKLPLDPLTNNQYIYSLTDSKKEYQLGGLLETNEYVLNGINNIYAATNEGVLKITGNYNGKLLKVNNLGITNLLAVPSIVTLCGTELEAIVNNNYFLYDGYNKFPLDYNGINTYNQCDGSGIPLVNSGTYELFSGDLNDLVGDDNKQKRIDLISNLQLAYDNTKSSNDLGIQDILNIDTNNEIEKSDNLAKTIIRNSVNKNLFSYTNGLSNTETSVVITQTNRYPGCNTDDITIGTTTIAACNVGAIEASTTNVNSWGELFQWGNNNGLKNSNTSIVLYC